MQMPSALPPPVQVRFVGLYQPDMPALAESLIPFGRWSEEHIAAYLPVAVSFPAEISQRLAVLDGYLAPGGWPPDVSSDAIATIREIVKQMVPQVEADIAQGVRLAAAATIRDDGSRAVGVRDQVLSVFLASKMLATARALLGCILVGEPTLDWGPEFHQMARVYSNRLIHGLSFLTREPHGWAGWTDADLWVGDRRYRLFAPICPDPESTVRAATLSSEDVQRLIIPQVLCPEMYGPSFFSAIHQLAFQSWETLKPGLILRAEVFVDAETCRDHLHAKAYITRIAADRIASRLQQIPPKARWRQFLKMTITLDAVSHEVADRVREGVPVD